MMKRRKKQKEVEIEQTLPIVKIIANKSVLNGES